MGANKTYRATGLVDSNVFGAEALPSDILFYVDGTVGTNDYEALINKPTINGVELVGNKTLEELGIASGSSEPQDPPEEEPTVIDGYEIATDDDIDSLFG